MILSNKTFSDLHRHYEKKPDHISCMDRSNDKTLCLTAKISTDGKKII